MAKDIQFCIHYTVKNSDKILLLKNRSYDVDCNGITLNMGKYFTKWEKDNFGESHRKYLDVPIMIDGSEKVAINDIRNISEKRFDSEKALVILEGDKIFDVIIENGDVLVFFQMMCIRLNLMFWKTMSLKMKEKSLQKWFLKLNLKN